MTATNKPKDAKVREFTLQFDKRTYDWLVITQSAIQTDDGYETRVVEHSAYTAALEEIERLKGDLEFANDVVKERESWAAMRLKTCKKLEDQNASLTEKLASLEKMIEVSEKALEEISNCETDHDHTLHMSVTATEALEQIKQMKAGLG